MVAEQALDAGCPSRPAGTHRCRWIPATALRNGAVARTKERRTMTAHTPKAREGFYRQLTERLEDTRRQGLFKPVRQQLPRAFGQ